MMSKEQMIGTADARTLMSTTRTIAMGLALTQDEYLRIMMIYGQAVERMELEMENLDSQLKPCTSSECPFQDGKCAINGCGGYEE